MMHMSKTLPNPQAYQGEPKLSKKFPATVSFDASAPSFAESTSSAAESDAELDILKAIITREGYLARLLGVTKTVKRKFKPELVDLIDFVRASTLEVVDAVVKWRNIKNEPDAVFMWNNCNYLLKIATDLDFLAEYRAIRKWMGFKLNRNPFCVPCPLEDGTEIFSDAKAVDPQHIDHGKSIDGFAIGGQAPSKFALGAHPAEDLTISPPKTPKDKRRKIDPDEAPYGAVGSTIKKAKTRIEGIYGIKKSIQEKNERPVESFIFNSDMVNIRRAEQVILAEEKRFGTLDRSAVIAGGLAAMLESVVDADVEIEQEEAIANSDAIRETESLRPISKGKTVDFADLKFADSLNTPINRHIGQLKLAPVTSKSMSALSLATGASPSPVPSSAQSNPKSQNATASAAALRPIGSMTKYQKKRTLGDRLAEIARLRSELEAEKLALDNEQRNANADTFRGAKKLPTSSAKTSRLPSGAAVKAGVSIDIFSSNNDASQSTVAVNPNDSAASSSVGGNMTQIMLDIATKTSHSDDNGAVAMTATPSTQQQQQQQQTGIRSWEDILRDEGLDDIHSEENKAVELTDAQQQEIERKKLREWRLQIVALGKRKGRIPPPELFDVLDYFATLITRMVVGYAKRKWAKKHRVACMQSSILMQAHMRGFIVRNRNWIARKRNNAARDIQRCLRGYKSRIITLALALNKRRQLSAISIQKIWRGIWGRARAKGKKALDEAARNIRKNVDPRNLFVSDVKELRMRIYFALDKNQPHSLPPDEVLFLLRLVAAIIQESTKTTSLGDLSFVNTRTYLSLDGYSLTWEDAERLLSRYERFLRLIRTVAYAPSSVPPCLINVPSKAKILFAAISHNRRWCLETFEGMGHGAKLCCQLYKWLISLIEISTLQQEFISFYSTSFPDWLPKLNDMQRAYREIEFKCVMSQKCNLILKDIREQITDDQVYRNLLGSEIAALRRNISQFEEILQQKAVTIQHAKDAQTKREFEALATLENRLRRLENDLVDLNKAYHSFAVQAAAGNKSASLNLPKIRDKMNLKQLAIEEMKSQIHMLTIQATQNQLKRQEKGDLPLEIRIKAITAGESKALVVDAETKARVLLNYEEVEYPEDLPMNKQRIYKSIKEQETTCLNIFQKLYIIADSHLQEYETGIVEGIASIRNIEKQAMINPSEAELEEEKRENEYEEMIAKFKKKAFIPDVAIRAPIERARPILVCLSRDLPAFAKEKIHRELTVCMPGLFISLDLEQNMGLNLDAMQSILDCKRCIVATVDHGLTKTSRSKFLLTLERTVNALIPAPFVVVAMADDFNKRLSAIDIHYGASKRDLQLMQDGDIKICLEGMAETLFEWSQSSVNDRFAEIVENVFPPSPEFLVVAEALYILQSDSDEKYMDPKEGTLKPMSWVAMRNFLCQPRALLSILQGTRRGKSSVTKLSVVSCYLEHPMWPEVGATARLTDHTLNLMAQYVEHWVRSEVLTKERGGIPLSPLTKGSLRGIQTVVVVSDVAIGDPEDLTNFGESTLGWRTASLRLLRTALQDMRVLKISKRVDGTLYNISIYREDSMVYFDAYDPQTSQLFILSARESQLPSLLLPSTHPNALTTDAEPPLTSADMYNKLAHLMHIKKIGNGRFARKVLYLHQDLLFLRNYTTKLNGHIVHVKCYEAALGEIVFKAYIPEFCASIDVSVDEETKLKLYRNFDSALESQLENTVDGRLLLPYMLDRLRATPTRPIVTAWGSTITGSVARFADAAAIKKSQGLSLRVSTSGGAGKVVFKTIAHFSGIPHLLSIKSSTTSKMMRVLAYEPKTQSKMELRITPFLRRIITGSDSDNANHWRKGLLNRLKLMWRGEHQLMLDTSIYKSVHKIAKRRVILTMDAVDESQIKVMLIEPSVGIPSYAILSRDDVIALFKHDYVPKLSPSKAIKKPTGVLNTMGNLFGSLLGGSQSHSHDQGQGLHSVSSSLASSPVKERGSHSNTYQLASSLEAADEHSLVEGQFNNSGTLQGNGFSGLLMSTFSTNPFNLSTNPFSKATGTNDQSDQHSVGSGSNKPITAQSKGNVLLVGDDVSLRSMLSKSSSVGSMDNANVHWVIGEAELLSIIDSNSLLQVISNKTYLAKLAKCLEFVIEYSYQSKQFITTIPIQVQFVPDRAYIESHRVPMNAALRHAEANKPKKLDPELIAGGAAGLVEGSVWNVLRARRQTHAVDMDRELNELAAARAIDMKEKKKALYAMYEPSKFGDNQLDTTSLLTDDDGDTSAMSRAKARSTAGSVKLSDDFVLWAHDGRSQCQLERSRFPMAVQQRLAQGELLCFEEGCKVNFRDGKNYWTGHVSVKVFESSCFYVPPSPLEGNLGKRYRFVVFDPSSSCYYEGAIRCDKHLSEVCGKKGQALLEPTKLTELMRYISRFRLYLSRIPADQMPEVIAAALANSPIPVFRVEFEIDRSYSIDKVTPVTDGGERDTTVNRHKLVESEMSRGKKILRLVRRIAGVLMHLVVFEVPEHLHQPNHSAPTQSLKAGKKKGHVQEQGQPLSPSKGLNEDAASLNLAVPDDQSLVSSIDGGGVESVMMGLPSSLIDASTNEFGFAEKRAKRSIATYTAPALRIVGFDPISKTKCVVFVPSAATSEIAGGMYSIYLADDRRKELAQVVCDSLFLVYPRGRAFELHVRWSGAIKEAATEVVAAKGSWRSSADRVIKRVGKIFRSITRISGLEIIVTIYMQPTLTKKRIFTLSDNNPQEVDQVKEQQQREQDEKAYEIERNSLMAGGDAGHYLGGSGGPVADSLQLIVNLYSSVCSEATEIVITTEEQIQRLGKPVLQHNEGSLRAAACRKLLRFFKCSVHEDSENVDRQILHVELMNTDKHYIAEQENTQKGRPVRESIDPVGIPKVFMPLDTCGYLINRREWELINKDKSLPDKMYSVTVYTRTHDDNPDQGLVIKIFDKESEETSIMHIQGNALQLMCTDAGEPDLLRDINYALIKAEDMELGVAQMVDDDGIDYSKKVVEMMDYLCDIFLPNVGVYFNERKKLLAYLRVVPKGLDVLLN